MRKVCVVTGSSSGIGAATAKLFASHGWNVVVNYARSAGPAEAVAQECRALGVEALVIRADVADDAQCRAMAAAVEARWGRADVLVNNAGMTRFVPAEDLEGLSAQDFHDIANVNVVGTFQASRAFVPLLKCNPVSAIVNVSSVAGSLGMGSSLAYMASKGAVNALTLGLARSLAPHIRVNAVAPGFVETPWMKNGLGGGYDSGVTAYKQRAVLEDVASPDDVADAIWWLGAGARKTTGEIVYVDAGMKMRKL